MIKSGVLALFVLAAPAFARERPLEVGVVDMQRLFKGYHRTEIAQKERDVEIARLQKQEGDRVSWIRDIDAGLEKLRRQIEDPAVAESKKAELHQQLIDGRQEGIALERERRDFVEGRRRSINERTLQAMKGLLNEIRKQLDEIAKTEDYDFVFDASGLSTFQMPFVLTSTADDDLTEMVLTKLNAGVANQEAEPVPE